MQYAISSIAAGSLFLISPATAKNESVAEVQSQTADPNQKIKCRRVDVTGSLIKKVRVCKTVAEWRTIMENGNYNARKLVEDGTSRSISN